ncbi:MAG: alanine--glyoxylate aminotransferase family protein [Candidatus Aminicenantes bacterium]|nr:alanine--glyoxylate aminotransferase family protein [Candidatus Aminicenantes bacterium]
MAQQKLLLIPGPSPVLPRILDRLAEPTVSHVGPEMGADLKEAVVNLKKIVFCERGEAFIVAGAGTLSMEMALLNTVAPGERALVLSQGYFGDRMAEIGRAFGMSVDLIQSRWGTVVSPDELAIALRKAVYRVVAVTHVDTATGSCAPIEDYAKIVRPTGALFIVDGVCATGGIPERMDDWGIDVVLTAAQKCFGAPPGLAVLVLSERAMDKRKSMPSVPAYYSDLLRWLPIMNDPTKYFSTPCVNEIRSFAEGTRVILEEGIENRFRRHGLFARAIRAGLSALGFTFLTDSSCLADTLSVAVYPEGVEDKAFRGRYAEKGVVVAGGLAQTAGKVFRMGHMGNLTKDQVEFALGALEETLADLGVRREPGAAVAAARRILEGRP